MRERLKKLVIPSIVILVLTLLLVQKVPLIQNADWPTELTWSTRVTEGLPLYPAEGNTFVDTSLEEGGYCMLPYGPLYYLLWGNIDKIGSASSATGSAISFGATLITSIFLYLLVKKLSGKKIIGIVSSVLFLTSITVTDWSIAPRPDMMALMLTVIGMYIVVRKRALYAIPIFALAVFTKQSYIVAPIAVCVYLLWKDRKELIKFIVGLAACVLIPFLTVNYFTHGEFYRHVINFPIQSGGDGMIHWKSVPGSILILCILDIMAMSLGLGGWIYRLIKRKIGITDIWLLVAFVVMALTIGKPGAAFNYGLETVTVACISGALLVGTVLYEKNKRFLRNATKET
jgi:4-amino-4-deoxy-L-arabinose transferase-like glycosyltransferase